MKQSIQVWTLSWDTAAGTDCRVFGSESEWFGFFRARIEDSIREASTPQADAVRASLAAGDVGSAYELWQASDKPELDSYNWDTQAVMAEFPKSLR
jgi:hypothetical protein